jgi:hypothetical protein
MVVSLVRRFRAAAPLTDRLYSDTHTRRNSSDQADAIPEKMVGASRGAPAGSLCLWDSAGGLVGDAEVARLSNGEPLAAEAE